MLNLIKYLIEKLASTLIFRVQPAEDEINLAHRPLGRNRLIDIYSYPRLGS
jgi:hypothetical protein